MLSNASSIAIIVSPVIVSVAAIVGVQTWRREMKDKARFDLAKRIMIASFRFVDDFKWAVFPLTRGDESAVREHIKESETDKESLELDEWYARSNRLQPLINDLKIIQEGHWESKVLFDEEMSRKVGEALTICKETYAELASAISTYFDIMVQGAKTGIPYKNQAFLRKLHKTIYGENKDLSEKGDLPPIVIPLFRS